MSGISIIIISYNRPDDSLALLQDLRKLDHQDLLQEIILLNNASTADYGRVQAFIADQPGWPCRLVDAPENLGVSKGRNFAAELAIGSIFFFLDDDVAIEDPKILIHLENAFKGRAVGGRTFGVIACNVKYAVNREWQINAFPHKDFNGKKNLSHFLTYYYVGCAHAFRKETWEAAGPYPVDFFYGMEEYDESYRVIDLGYAIAYDATIEVFHKESPGGRRPRAEQLRMMWVNKSVVARKYLPPIYFYTTAVAWAISFLLRSKINIREFGKGMRQILGIPGRVKRRPLNAESLRYLREVKARLWF